MVTSYGMRQVYNQGPPDGFQLFFLLYTAPAGSTKIVTDVNSVDKKDLQQPQ